ncbi:MAG: hypothetical protein MZW92_78485 [Comamonadaceae bacterium]|nr:hypothetical protein [Comamonadaceae bacterium]
MSAPLFRLAGSGWYETDFKSDKEQQAQPGARRATRSRRRPKTKADATPETKTESKASRRDCEAIGIEVAHDGYQAGCQDDCACQAEGAGAQEQAGSRQEALRSQP